MKYEKIVKGKFVARPNRFIAEVEIDGKCVRAHVKNTGRCRELLIPGAKVYLEDWEDRMAKRKLRYSLICVEKKTDRGVLLVNMDSQAPNKVVKEALEEGSLLLPGVDHDTVIKPEAVYGDSRIDFKLEAKDGLEAYIEVKGVTLESDGEASFPDAPTERGIKHLKELEKAVAEGKKAFAVFVIQMEGMKTFSPNDRKHKEFGEALRNAASKGVQILAYECFVRPDELKLSRQVIVKL